MNEKNVEELERRIEKAAFWLDRGLVHKMDTNMNTRYITKARALAEDLDASGVSATKWVTTGGL